MSYQDPQSNGPGKSDAGAAGGQIVAPDRPVHMGRPDAAAGRVDAAAE